MKQSSDQASAVAPTSGGQSMTPDELTPDTLRGWAYADAFAPATILAHADQWRAETKDWSGAVGELQAEVHLLNERLEAAEKALEDMVRQFAHECSKDGRPAYGTGGLSALEEAFSVLRWNDPQPALDRECQAAGCHKWASCGVPTRDGYRWLCGDHYAALKEKP
jgi:hypothetical protein